MKYELLLDLVKKSISTRYDKSISIDKEQLYLEYPALKQTKATFVTLSLNNKLRGCIGSLVPRRTLLEDLLNNAYDSAFGDLRFDVLTKEEFKNISFEISILSETILCEYENIEDLKSKIIPFKHGVILNLDGKRATFLPQVWEQLPTFEDFFSNLCLKARCESNCLLQKPQIYLYEVVKIK